MVDDELDFELDDDEEPDFDFVTEPLEDPEDPDDAGVFNRMLTMHCWQKTAVGAWTGFVVAVVAALGSAGSAIAEAM